MITKINHVSNKNRRIFTNDYIAFRECKHGFLFFNINDQFVGKSIDMYGEWCDTELHLLSQVIQATDVVLDIGANIGTHTIYFAQKVTETGLVYAFEPQRLVFQTLCANIGTNALTNVICYQLGLGDEKASTKVPFLNPRESNNVGAMSIENNDNGEEIEIITIDELKLNKCKLIKIDAEGMENKVLHGAFKTINSLKPIIFIENNQEDCSSEIIRSLFSLDYDCYWHIAHYYNPDNYLNYTKDIFPDNKPQANMLCVHKKSNIKVSGLSKVRTINDNWLKARLRILGFEAEHNPKPFTPAPDPIIEFQK